MPDMNNAAIDICHITELLPLKLNEHMHRVGRLVGTLSRIMFAEGIGSGIADRNELLYYGEAAFYHDIGKAFVPFSLLNKPGKFTKEEMNIMKKHPVCAQVIFMDIDCGLLTGMPSHLVEPARNAAIYHHECWNGGGYPCGTRFEEIPLIARITSVCDAYDAMTSNRVYRHALTHADACFELSDCAGKQFDPEVVRVFLNSENEILCAVKNDSRFR